MLTPGAGTESGADEFAAPRKADRLIAAAFGLYRRYPWLFFVLAAGVIVPYELIVLTVTGSGVFTRESVGISGVTLLGLIDWVVIGPLVSALHVHAVGDVRRGRHPSLPRWRCAASGCCPSSPRPRSCRDWESRSASCSSSCRGSS